MYNQPQMYGYPNQYGYPAQYGQQAQAGYQAQQVRCCVCGGGAASWVVVCEHAAAPGEVGRACRAAALLGLLGRCAGPLYRPVPKPQERRSAGSPLQAAPCMQNPAQQQPGGPSSR
jgi:hypothetical protein